MHAAPRPRITLSSSAPPASSGCRARKRRPTARVTSSSGARRVLGEKATAVGDFESSGTSCAPGSRSSPRERPPSARADAVRPPGVGATSGLFYLGGAVGGRRRAASRVHRPRPNACPEGRPSTTRRASVRPRFRGAGSRTRSCMPPSTSPGSGVPARSRATRCGRSRGRGSLGRDPRRSQSSSRQPGSPR